MKFNIKHKGRNQNRFDGMSCYGKRIKVSKFQIKSLVMFMAIAIPVIFPVPLAMLISKFVKRDLTLRY